MKKIKSKQKLEQNIGECFTMDSSSVLTFDSDYSLNNNFAHLLPLYMIESLQDISIDNNYLLELMDCFLPTIDYSMEDNFSDLKGLNTQQLMILKEFLLYVASHQIDLLDENISQGFYAIECNIQFNEILNSLTDYFSPNTVLKEEEIILPYFEEIEHEEDIRYMKELYANQSWIEIAEKAEGEFYFANEHGWLSNKAKYFLVPAVIYSWGKMFWGTFSCEYFFFTKYFEKFDLLTHSQAKLVTRFINLKYEVNRLLFHEFERSAHEENQDLKKALDKYWGQFLLD